MAASGAKEAGIQKQIRLPWSKAFEIAMNAIRRRFIRTIITAIGILLGIAFLVSVLSGGAFAEAAARSHGPTSAQWIAFLNSEQETRQRQIWLVSLALLVSTMGISNSMLMSVAERYREIGTMKCLGATDSFVVQLFIIEAALTGMIASTLGGVLGFVVMLISYLVQDGVVWLPFATFGPLVIETILAILGGALLALVASVWPASMAARMPPAAAFRVEV